MNDKNEQARSQQSESDLQACCDGGSCCPSGSDGGSQCCKMVVFILIVLAAGIVLARSIIKRSDSATEQGQDTFAAIAPQVTGDTPLPQNANATTQQPTAPKGDAETPAVATIDKEESVAPQSVEDKEVIEQEAAASPVDEQEPVVKVVEQKRRVGEFLDSLASLNKVAVNQDAVFVFIPAKGNDTVNKRTTDAIASAEKKIKSTGVSLGFYTLQSGSPEYANIAAQLPLPGMLVMSKGRGMGAVSGEITETKLLQAYVASSQAGGCGPSGCGPAGCN